MDKGGVNALMTLPIGWQSFPATVDSAFAMQVAGWLLTASTALFGAPFWFDLLQRTVQIRGTGEKPAQQSKEEPLAPRPVSVDENA